MLCKIFPLTAQELKSTRKLNTVKYVPIKVESNSISLRDSKIELDKSGFPKQINTFYNSTKDPIKLLFENIHFHFVRKSDGKNIILKDGVVKFSKNDKNTDRWNGIVKWKSTNRNDSLIMDVSGKLKFDGHLSYKVKVSALQDVLLKDVTMHIPFIPTLPTIMMGFGINEGKRPEKVEWKWDGPFKDQRAAWLGNPDSGIQYTLRKGAWANENKGGVTIAIKGSSMLANNYTGEHEMKNGDVLYYNFNILIKPLSLIERRKN